MYKSRQRPVRLVWSGLLGFLCGAVAGAHAPLPQESPNAAPVFTEGTATTRLMAENTEAGRTISPPVNATDADGHRLTYSLDGDDADAFALDPRSGRLRTRDGINYDYEVKDRYAVIVRAEDGHGGSAAIAVVVEVTDELEPPSAPAKPTIAERTRDGLTVRWTAPANTGPELRDYDGRYRIAGADAFEPGWDRIGAVTEATIRGLIADTVYEVQVRARNAVGVGAWSEPAEGRTEKNRVPVFIEGASTTRQLDENTLADVNVGAPVSASDADGDRLVYSLEQAEQSAFRINANSGQLSTRAGAVYQYETQPTYAVTVRVEDGFGASAASVVTVSISDVETPALAANAGWDLTVSAGATAWLGGTVSGTDRGELTYSWSFVSWPGESAPALNGAGGATPSFVAAVEGTYVVRLTVTQNSLSHTDDVAVVARPSTDAGLLLVADLLVDANRDGLVDSSDEAGEETWDSASGAVFGPNADDDDGDGVRDGWDNQANGVADLLDMAPAVVRQIPGLHLRHTVVVEMTFGSVPPRSTYPPPPPRARLFYERTNGQIELLFDRGAVPADLPLDQLVAGDVRLYLDSRLGRSHDFDGQLWLTLTLKDGETVVSQDTVALRGGPILFSHHLESAERVFVVDVGTGRFSNRALVDGLASRLPVSVDLYKLSEPLYSRDRWIQDSMQTGYVQRPSVGGVRTTEVHTQLHRGRRLGAFLRDTYLAPEKGYEKPGVGLHSDYSNYNYGGNVEVIPPHTHGGRTFPFGRVVVGGRAHPEFEAMTQRQVDFINAQGVQGPVLVVDTSWLMINHVDEIFTVLPNRNAGTGERSWVIAIGSTELAVDLLEEAVEDGYGDAALLKGHGRDETTPAEILADESLMAINETAQRRIDTVRDRLIAEVGLEDADFREVPALFHDDWFGKLVAFIPSVQNLLVVNDVLLVPDPEGPTVEGVDIFRQATLDAVDGLGLTSHFLDVYASYHVLHGALHCGTNVERTGSVVPWWLSVETEDGE